MSTALPGRWPHAVTPDEALGYLLARHVPPTALPAGLKMAREAAGWRPVTGLQPDRMQVPAITARAWVRAAAAHARALGPPPGLTDLLHVLADGVIRTRDSARLVLAAAGAGDLADPKILADFAGWTGADLPFVVLPVGVRHGRRVWACMREAGDLTRTRTLVDALTHEYGVIGVQQALDLLAGDGLVVEAGDDPQALHALLRTAGDHEWLWPCRQVVTPLTTAMTRLAALGVPITVQDVPEAVARLPRRRRAPVEGLWPLPIEAIRAWARQRPQWRLLPDDTIEPAGERPSLQRHDEVLVAAFAPGGPQSWKQLCDALTEAGMNPPAAAAAIRCSPVLHRSREGYTLLGLHPPNAPRP